jgi:hypothetical protein
MRWSLAACVAAAAVATACGSNPSGAGPGEQPTSSGADVEARAPCVPVDVELTAPSTPVDIEVVGGSPEQRALLAEILAGMGAPRLERVVVRKPDPIWNYAKRGDVEIVVEDMKGSGVRGWWDAWVVALTFGERSEEMCLPQVVAGTVRGEGSLFVGPDEPPPRPPCEDASEQDAAALAARHGAGLVKFERLTPSMPAYAVTVVATDPAGFLEAELARLSEGVWSLAGGCAGGYLEILDESGEFVWAGGTASSSGLTNWTHRIRKGLEGCDLPPVSIPDPETYVEPPPCPE